MEERLKQYNEIKAEISNLKWKIKVLENEEIQPATAFMEITGIKPKGYMKSPIENKIAKKNDEINMYNRQMEELQLEIDMIDSKINILKDLERKVIIDYYINNRTAIDIASYIYREEVTVYKMLRRAIKRMDKQK